MKKNQIQAGATVSKKGERKFIAGFFVSTVFGQLLTNYNSTAATASATVLSIGIETGLRPFLTKSKPTLCLVFRRCASGLPSPTNSFNGL